MGKVLKSGLGVLEAEREDARRRAGLVEEIDGLEVDQPPFGGERDLGDHLAGRKQEGPVVEIDLDDVFGSGLELGNGLQFGHVTHH